MPGEGQHRCRYRFETVWSEWEEREGIRQRSSRRIPLCRDCGAERPSRGPRPVREVEMEAVSPGPEPLLSSTGRHLAQALARRRKGRRTIGAKGLLGQLSREKQPGSVVEEQLERFLRAGWIRLVHRVRGTRRELSRVEVLRPSALEDAAEPGLREARLRALEDAESALAAVAHPVADEVRHVLAAEPGLSPEMIEALVAVAAHADSGEVLAERVFSARHLGDSKALLRHRKKIETRLGPLHRLGIREGGAVTLLGGSGRLELERGALDLALLGPFLGLSREALAGLTAVSPPSGGVLVVENHAAFEACCRGEVEGARDGLIVWSAGYPGRGVRSVVEAAARAGARPVVWADLDLDGVRIVRVVNGWAPAGTYRMGPEDLEAAPVRLPLTKRAAAAIEADLTSRPDALLAATLAAILDAGEWAEQEVFL